MSASHTPLLHLEDEIDGQPRSNYRFISKIHALPSIMNSSAPLAKSEIEDDGTDDREVVSKPYPGVDDGFFDNTNNNGGNTDVEKFDPSVPRIPEIEITPNTPDADEIPNFAPRFGPAEEDGKNPRDVDQPDSTDGAKTDNGRPSNSFPNKPHFLTPGFGFDMEGGSIPGDFDQSIPDVNIYQHKKTLAQGMMDLALFSANANQLRYVLESYDRHPYFYPSVVLIAFSLLLQIGVGIGLIWNATYNVKDEKEICIANRINNFTVIGIFLVTVINVFISAFGVANPPTST